MRNILAISHAARAALVISMALISTSAFAAEKATLQGRTASTQTVAFDIFLPLQNRDQVEPLLADLHNSASPNYQHWLTPAQFQARFGATDAQVAAIVAELAAQHLTATRTSAYGIHVTGSATDIERTFKTVLQNATFASGKSTVVATAPITPTASLAQVNATVTGLSGMIYMRRHSAKAALPANRYSSTGGYWFDDLKQAYSYPSYQALNGKGVTIGILMSGDFNPPDMTKYFTHEKLAVPNFSTVQIDGGYPFDPNDSFETHLDLQQSGGMAPLAKIVLYNLPDLSDNSIIDGLTKILADNKADVVSMSFGGPEIYYTPAFNDGTDFTYLLKEEDNLMAQGNAQGITFIASSGDAGALDAPSLDCLNGLPNCGTPLAAVEFPASSPHVTGVGGTNLITTYTGLTGDLNSQYLRESAFADPLAEDIFYGTSATGGYWGSGGGTSVLFPKPLFQAFTNTGSAKFRTVPDLALHMGGCPGGTISCGTDDSFDYLVIGNQYFGVIGTSASAPDFAGLTALTVQRYGTRLGNVNYYAYSLALLQSLLPILPQAFRNDVPGFNGLYYSGQTPGYNRVLGLGTVNGKNFLTSPLIPAAGIPQTPTNP
jgi:subtilase family serine protease